VERRGALSPNHSDAGAGCKVAAASPERLGYGPPADLNLSLRLAVMIQRPALPAALALLLAWLVPVAAQGEAAEGARLARQWCANCHVIDDSGPATTIPQGPPSFRIIAGHLNPEQMRSFLTHPHGAMPDLGLTRAEIDNLIAYIESLR
jgi:mono/diheme cytochrome c family protein